jgi:hypothetical protein
MEHCIAGTGRNRAILRPNSGRNRPEEFLIREAL